MINLWKKKEVDFVIINGLKWDKINTIYNSSVESGEAYYYYRNSGISASKKLGKRLPTVDEFYSLINTGYTYERVNGTGGLWFGVDNSLKSDSKQSIFLPFYGHYAEDANRVYDYNSRGLYWADPGSNTGIYPAIEFYLNTVYISYHASNTIFPIRCVRDI